MPKRLEAFDLPALGKIPLPLWLNVAFARNRIAGPSDTVSGNELITLDVCALVPLEAECATRRVLHRAIGHRRWFVCRRTPILTMQSPNPEVRGWKIG